MVLVGDKIGLTALTVRGQVGRCAGAGFLRCGFSRCGAPAGFGGVYTRVLTLKGWDVARRRYYRPSNPQTAPQQSWRGIFSDGVAAYHALTDAERALLLKKARTRGMSGFNLFMSSWLQSRRA